MITGKVVPCLDTACAARDPIFVNAAVNAILEPHGLGVPDPQSNLRGARIIDVAEEILHRNGVGAAGESARRMIVAQDGGGLYSTSDFPQILLGIAQRALLAGWESGPNSYERFCGTTDVQTLRPEQRLVVGGLGKLAKLSENGEVLAGNIPGYAVKTAAEAYGTAFRITREALINNDLGGVIDSAKAIGRAAAATLSDAVFALIEANPMLLDGGALFNTSSAATLGGHSNMAAAGTVLSSATLAAGKASMRRQTAPGGDRPLNIRARYLLVPAELEEQAWDIVGLPQGFGEIGSDVERYFIDAGRVEPISVPYLNDDIAWYLAADPSIAPLMNIAYLHGVAAPTLTGGNLFRSNGVEFVARFDFGVSPADWRGGYANPGASP